MNRIKQFFVYAIAKVNINDKIYIEKHLNNDEMALFNKLSIHEQKHSINVARDVEKECRVNLVNSKNLVKAALLHDIGKINVPITLIDKSIVVILDKITRSKIKKFKKIKKIYIYYNHGYEGFQILKRINENEQILFMVNNHHNREMSNNLELDILKKCDDRN
ncbi:MULTISPECIES: HD domain-containing protein [Clostridium]|uniref:HD domain-containing protein n=1 Tax=Clostridium TaxID=1485 RepID=UPI0006C09459|nr:MULTISPECIES: HD domain-containing protein [Clostridium]KOF57723.1 HD family phosphohydrolase [Clostridium sp. DMHC 10]MCD2348950.1 HDIG domain-containing protein [Clostridium guangxiense]